MISTIVITIIIIAIIVIIYIYFFLIWWADEILKHKVEVALFEAFSFFTKLVLLAHFSWRNAPLLNSFDIYTPLLPTSDFSFREWQNRMCRCLAFSQVS